MIKVVIVVEGRCKFAKPLYADIFTLTRWKSEEVWKYCSEFPFSPQWDINDIATVADTQGLPTLDARDVPEHFDVVFSREIYYMYRDLTFEKAVKP